jgi:predicted KAP-like P-loop ATPase
MYGWESGRDLTLVKAELNALLSQLKHKIIIIIDNISRLEPQEIKQMFQIIKSMGDYANTVYLLAIDKEQIKNDYDMRLLEKVVQLPFDVPPISQQDIEAILADRLMNVINTIPEDAWQSEYWADVYYSALKLFFRHCRDITRYINTLSFSYSRISDIVNPVDFFALTAIEVFEPDVYAGIRDNKDLFSDLFDGVYQLSKADIEKDKIRCNEILSRSHRIPQDIILELLIRLFPRLRNIYQPMIEFYHSEASARRSKRICCPDLFNAYFRLSMQAGNISESEFSTILSLASSKEAFDQALTRLNQDENRVVKFLDQLDSKALQHVPLDNIPAIINSLLDNGDLFPEGSSGPLHLATSMRIHRIIHALLRRIPSTDERHEILSEAIVHATKSLYIIVHELNEQGREHLETEEVFLPLEFRDLSNEQLYSLRDLAINNIKVWAKDGRLMDHPRLLPILQAWLSWSNNNECHDYIETLTESDHGLVVFLLATLDKAITQTETEYTRSPDWEIYLEDIKSFIAIEKIDAHARALFEDGYFEKLREKEQLALLIFLDLIKIDTTKTIPSTSV